MSSREEFGLEVYKQIRAEVSALLARIETLFRYSLVASASVFAWLLTQAYGVTKDQHFCVKLPKEALELAWCIPATFIILSGLIALGTHVRVMQMGEFLCRCELALGSNRLSWEVYLKPKPPLFTTMSVLAWLFMLCAAVYAAKVGLALPSKLVCSASAA